mgnify:CR=1 FL=1
MAKKTEKKMLRIKLVKSGIGYTVRTKRTLNALGLRKLQSVVEHEDTAVLRGMLDKVSHLVEVESAVEEK